MALNGRISTCCVVRYHFRYFRKSCMGREQDQSYKEVDRGRYRWDLNIVMLSMGLRRFFQRLLVQLGNHRKVTNSIYILKIDYLLDWSADSGRCTYVGRITQCFLNSQ